MEEEARERERVRERERDRERERERMMEHVGEPGDERSVVECVEELPQSSNLCPRSFQAAFFQFSSTLPCALSFPTQQQSDGSRLAAVLGVTSLHCR